MPILRITFRIKSSTYSELGSKRIRSIYKSCKYLYYFFHVMVSPYLDLLSFVINKLENITKILLRYISYDIYINILLSIYINNYITLQCTRTYSNIPAYLLKPIPTHIHILHSLTYLHTHTHTLKYKYSNLHSHSNIYTTTHLHTCTN